MQQQFLGGNAKAILFGMTKAGKAAAKKAEEEALPMTDEEKAAKQKASDLRVLEKLKEL